MANGILTADWHFTDRQEDCYRFDLVDWLVQQIRDYDVDFLAIMGDLTDSKDRHSSVLVNAVSERLSILAKECEVIVLKGNHDYIDEYNPFFKFLSKFSGIYYVDDLSTLQFGDPGEEDIIYAISHTRSKKRLLEALAAVRTRQVEPDLIIMHQTVNGAMTSTGYKLEGIETSAFRGMRCPVWSGDIHVPQKVGVVNYSGSPYRIRFGDDFTPRVVLWENGQTRDLHFPTLLRSTEVIKVASELLDRELRKGDQVKVRLDLDRSQLSEWSAHTRSIIEVAKKLQIEVFGIELLATKEHDLSSSSTSKVEQSTPRMLFDQYCENEQVDQFFRGVGEEFLEAAGLT